MKTIATRHRIVHGSATQLNMIGSNSIELVATSPPYGDVKEYDRANSCNIGNYKDDEYRALMKAVYRECYRVLKPGRRMCINISDVPIMTDWGQAVGMYGQMTVDIVNEIGGFVLNNIIIWTKGRCRAGSDAVGTLPYPGSPVLLNNWEYIYIFKKKGAPIYPRNDDIRNASTITTEELKDWLYCTWAIRPEVDRRHIAPYPIEIPYRLIRLFTYVGDTVYDPFAGSGTTMRAAINTGRSSVGYDIGYDLTEPARKSLNNSPKATWIDLIKLKTGWGQQHLEPIRDLVMITPIKYEFLEDEESLASVSELINDEDLTMSPVCNLQSTSECEPQAKTNEQTCKITPLNSPVTVKLISPNQPQIPYNEMPLYGSSVPTDESIKRVLDFSFNDGYTCISNGKLVWLKKYIGYPILEV